MTNFDSWAKTGKEIVMTNRSNPVFENVFILIFLILPLQLVFGRTKIIKNQQKNELFAGVNSMCTGFNLCLIKLGLSLLLL